MTTPYEDLGLPEGASKEEVRKAFRRAAAKHHPDRKWGNKEKFQKAQAAYAALTDESKQDEPDRLAADARRELIMLFLQEVEKHEEPGRVCLIQNVEANIKVLQKGVEQKIDAIKKRKKKLQKALKKLRPKADTTFLQDALTHTLAQCDQMLNDTVFHLKLAKLMLTILKEGYDPDIIEGFDVSNPDQYKLGTHAARYY